MPESTLSIDRAELLAQGSYLAFGTRSLSRVPQEEKDQLDSVLKSALRKFYFPVSVDPNLAHQWSFLTPGFTFPIETGIVDYDLPGDWGGIQGRLTFASDDNVTGEVRKVTVEQILLGRQAPQDVTGPPEKYSERPKSSLGMTDQRWQLLIWPEPDSTYTLHGSYRVHPNALTNTLDHPYGGVEHAETILEAFLAEIEQRLLRETGTHSVEFPKRLMASVAYDRSQRAPEHLGYNGDLSIGRSRSRYRRAAAQTCTVDGVLYDD